ncbi:MAG TPA: hypothetical protein VFV87_06090 [Pirellulaceae bacterium]|nr:hypothetical protein [Pirellulaceae bacterium]
MATISTNAPPFSAEVIATVLSAAAIAVALAIWLSARTAIRETTLVGPWWWALAAIIGWGGVEIAAAGGWLANGAWLAPLRMAAMGLSFCPAVALVGAKRPQHAAWSFVVVSLWVIVVLPAAEGFFLRRGQELEMGDARGWFLWILILLGPANFAPTRFWLAALLLAGGQIVALGKFLPLARGDLVIRPGLTGFVMSVMALLAAWLAAVPFCPRNQIQQSPYELLWIHFRNAFGLFWSLRVQERVNAAAAQYGWDFRLTWTGLKHNADGQPLTTIDPKAERAFRTTLRGLLRRFVSSRWIADRLQGSLD